MGLALLREMSHEASIHMTTLALGCSLLALPVVASDLPKCVYMANDYEILSVIPHDDGHEYVVSLRL